jgi:hypothetical protein
MTGASVKVSVRRRRRGHGRRAPQRSAGRMLLSYGSPPPVHWWHASRRVGAGLVDNFQLRASELPSVSGMAATITVDIAALRSLAAQLAGLAHLLRADNDEHTGIGSWVGDPKISTALKNIQHDWSHKRKEFIGYLEGVSHGAHAAADAYACTEASIRGAAEC